jgi:hypothetical protein
MTWRLVMQSFSVLRRNPRLAIFPVLSALAAIAVTVPYFWAIAGDAPWRAGDLQWSPMKWAVLFLWYCSCSFVMIFFNCALAACAQSYFSGSEATIGEGLQQAGQRAGQILAWAVVTSTVGTVFRVVEERAGWVGRIAAALFGAGWTVATYLMVPVLVAENRGVGDSIRRSTELLKKTWGEQLIVGIHFLWIVLLAAIPGIILGALAWPVGIVYFLALAAAVTTARGIFTVALYRYATTGEPPEGYSREGLESAFRPRGR